MSIVELDALRLALAAGEVAAELLLGSEIFSTQQKRGGLSHGPDCGQRRVEGGSGVQRLPTKPCIQAQVMTRNYGWKYHVIWVSCVFCKSLDKRAFYLCCK